MKYVVKLEGHDGLFSCKTEFKCGDEFFARGISNYGDDDIDYLSNELAKDISGEIYAHFEEVIQEAETNGEDSEKVGKNSTTKTMSIVTATAMTTGKSPFNTAGAL